MGKTKKKKKKKKKKKTPHAFRGWGMAAERRVGNVGKGGYVSRVCRAAAATKPKPNPNPKSAARAVGCWDDSGASSLDSHIYRYIRT